MRLLHEYENLIVIGYENVISRNIMGGIFRLTQQQNRREEFIWYHLYCKRYSISC